MKIKQFKNIIPALIIISLMTLIFASGSLAGPLKKRMKARLPQIISLKTKEVIGENNLGYLEYRNPQKAHKELIEAENQDRQTIYKKIAQRQNSTAENVGRRRAARITEKAPAGTWLQNSQGEWYKK